MDDAHFRVEELTMHERLTGTIQRYKQDIESKIPIPYILFNEFRHKLRGTPSFTVEPQAYEPHRSVAKLRRFEA